MDNPQYIEYLNTFGAEIDVSSQPRIEVDALPKEHITKEKELKILGRLWRGPSILDHIRYKYYQCCDLVKNFYLDDAEIERMRIINSIEKLRNKDLF